MGFVAIPWYVLETTGSATLTGVVAALTFAPTVLATFFGGGIVDRLGFRRTSILADVASGVTTAADPAALRDGRNRALAGHGPRLPRRAVRRARHDGAPLAPARPRCSQRDEARACDRDQQCDPARLAARRRSDRGAPRQRDRRDQRSLAERRDRSRSRRCSSRVSSPCLAPHPDAPAPGRYLSELLTGVRFVARDPLIRMIVLIVFVTNFLDAPFPVIFPVFAMEAFGSAVVPRHHARRLRRRGAGRLARLQRRRASTAAPPDVRVLVPARRVALHGARAAAVAAGHAGPDGRVGACLGAAEPRAPDRRLRARPGRTCAGASSARRSRGRTWRSPPARCSAVWPSSASASRPRCSGSASATSP